MDNSRLKILSGLYFNCKEQLNTLKEQVIINSIEIQLINDTGAVLMQKIKDTNDGLIKIRLQQVVNGSIVEQLKEAHLKADKSVSDITLPATENKIAYLEARLESIKKFLGDDYKEIEKYEKDKILKNK